MHLVLDLPEPKQSLDAALSRQFADIQRQLLGLVKSQQQTQSSMRTEWLTSMRQQQESLVDALARLMGSMQHSMAAKHEGMAPMAEALKGLKQAVADLPGDLRASLDRQFQQTQHQMAPSMPMKVTMQMPQGLTARLDGLEQAILRQPRGFRSRTFGSNY